MTLGNKKGDTMTTHHTASVCHRVTRWIAVALSAIIIMSSPSFAMQDKDVKLYALVKELHLRQQPFLSSKDESIAVSFGQLLNPVEWQDDWVLVRLPDSSGSGWVHETTVTRSRAQIDAMTRLKIKPTTVLYIIVQSESTFRVGILEGKLYIGTKRMLAYHGDCVVFSDEQSLSSFPRISMEGFGVSNPIVRPRPDTLYFYCSDDDAFRPVSDLIAAGKVVPEGQSRPSEPSVIAAVIANAQVRPTEQWPKSLGTLHGQNPVRITNPNPFSVRVALRSSGRGKDFKVSSNDSSTIYVPDGSYEIYFQYSHEPDAIYKGDDFSLHRHGVDIRVVKIVEGNYSIRRVK